MSEWKNSSLGEVINLKRGHDLPNRERINGNVPIYSSSGITGFHNEKISNGPGVITGRYGTIGKVFYSPTEYWPLNTTLYVEDFKANNELFIYYLLQQLDWEKYSDKSAVPGVNRNDVHQEIVSIPSIEEQKAIASVLSSLDDKIDLLHRQNTTLERMAETLFRQWFVEEAQEDWQRERIGDVLTTVLGGTPSTTKPEYWSGTVPWINSGEINKFRILEATKFISELGLKKSNAKLLPVGSTVVAITGATLGQVSLLEIETCANQSVIGIIPSERLPKEYVFLWIKLKIEEIILNETGGAQPHINKNDINNTEIAIPPADLLHEKNKIFEAWFNKITLNVFQIQTLEKLRDNLLPKLMSGEVCVS